jgi:hypothetical protein
MAYATIKDIEDRILRDLTADEQTIATNLLDDVAVMIDSRKNTASDAAKKVVSCRAVIRALGDGNTDIPVGATQGSQSGLGYSQSWTMGNGATGELYLSKEDRRLLGLSNEIGTYSPVEELCVELP